jgi:hypothetical protein
MFTSPETGGPIPNYPTGYAPEIVTLLPLMNLRQLGGFSFDFSYLRCGKQLAECPYLGIGFSVVMGRLLTV